MTPREIIVEVAKTYDVPEHDVSVTYSVPDPGDGTGTDKDLWIEVTFWSKFSYGRGRSHKQIKIYGEGQTPADALDQLRFDYVDARNAQWQRERKAKQKAAAKKRAGASPHPREG